MRFTYAATAVALVAVSNAQGSLPNIPPCGLSCFATAFSSDGCASVSDLACHCAKTGILDQITSCVSTACTADEQATIMKTISDTCMSLGVPITGASAGSASSAAPSASSTASAVSSMVESASSAPASADSGGSSSATPPVADNGTAGVPASPTSGSNATITTSPTPSSNTPPYEGSASALKIASGAFAVVIMGAAYLL